MTHFGIGANQGPSAAWAMIATLVASIALFGAGCGGQAAPDDLGLGGQTPESAEAAAIGLAQPPGLSHSASGFSLSVMPESFLGAAPSGSFKLDVNETRDSITVRVLGMGLTDQRAFYAQLHCPPGCTLIDAQAGAGLGAADGVLSLCHGEPGVVHLGAVLKHYDQRAGVSGAAELARVTLRRGTAPALRQARAVPLRTADHPVLYVDCTAKRLEWEHRLAGDYNQDGAVNLADLTPLALHWGEVGLEAGGFMDLGGVSFIVNSAQQVIDTSSDKQIGLPDLTAIGINFGARIAGWNLYRSMDPAQDFPDVDVNDPAGDGSVPSKITRYAYRDFAALKAGNPAQERLRFYIDLPLFTNGMAYWVRPVEAGREGAPSNWSAYEQALAAKFSLLVEPETVLFDPGISLAQNVCTRGPEQVVCRVDAGNVTTGQCFVFRTLFDSLEFNPQSFPVTPLVGDGAGGSVWLAGPYTHKGVAKFSNAPDDSRTLSPSGTCTIVRMVFLREPQTAWASSVVDSSYISLNLAYDAGAAKLSWLYGAHSDAGQDGDVWLDDFFTNRYYYSQLAGDPLAAVYIADANHDGGVNLEDITPIGIDYHKNLTGYNVYASFNPAEAPVDSSINGAPAVAPLARVALSAATGDPLVDRLRFSFTVPNPQPGMYLWVQPECEGQVGKARQGDYVQVP